MYLQRIRKAEGIASVAWMLLAIIGCWLLLRWPFSQRVWLHFFILVLAFWAATLLLALSGLRTGTVFNRLCGALSIGGFVCFVFLLLHPHVAH